MAFFLVLLTILQLAIISAASPVINFPFNSQLPPVARIAEPFSYTLSPQTFSSPPSSLIYSLKDAPDWLSIDEDTGRLHGTPTDDEVAEGDVVGVPVDIIAEDDSGSVAMTATLVVSRNRPPTVNIPLSEQIADFGDQSAPNAIVSYPSTPFSFTFADDTFSSETPLAYYATSADSSPLPSWMRFEPTTLTFSGETPPFENLVQPPQTFDFHLVGSDVEGFSGVAIRFSVVVGSRKLTMSTRPVVELNATRGKMVSYRGLRDDIELDGESIRPSDMDIATRDMPPWLSLDESTWEIKGTPPNDARSSNATITIRNSLSDTLSIRLAINVATNIFRRTLPDMEITPSKPFSLNLEPYLWRPNDVSLEIKTSPSQNWLKVDGLVISGTPPRSSRRVENFQLSVRARVRRSGLSETEDVQLRYLTAASLPTTSGTPSTLTPSQTQTQTASPTNSVESKSQESFGSGLNAGQIVLAVLVPILIIAGLMLLFICLRRRRERKFRKIEARDISGPVPGSFVQNGSLHSGDPSVIETVKAFNTIPPPQPAYRPGQRGYLRAALQRLRSTRTTSSFDSDSQVSVNLAPPTLPRLRSLSDHAVSDSRNSWLTEEGYLGMSSRGGAPSQRQSRHSILSLYESLRNLPRGPGLLRSHTESSWRSTLDVTIPSLNEDRGGIQPTPEIAYMFDKTKKGSELSRSNKPGYLTIPTPTVASSDALGSIHEQMSPLGSHPTNGKKVPPTSTGGFKVYSDREAESQMSFQTISGSADTRSRLDAMSRQESKRSDLSYARPVSRRSDASPWFGGRSVVPARSVRKQQLDYSSSSASASVSMETDTDVNGNENWQTIPRDSIVRGTENWQTIPRNSTGIVYEELVRESPFYPRTPVNGPRPRGSVGTSLNDENRRQSSWMGKGVSLRRDRNIQRGSESTASLLSPSKWDTGGRAPLGDRPISSIRHVQPSARIDRPIGAALGGAGSGGRPVLGTNNSSRNSKLSRPGSEVSDWVTDVGTMLERDNSSSRPRRQSVVAKKEDSQKSGLGRDRTEEDFAVYI